MALYIAFPSQPLWNKTCRHSNSERCGFEGRGPSLTRPHTPPWKCPRTPQNAILSGPRGTTHGSRGTTQGSRGTTQGSTGATQGSRGATQGSRGATKGSRDTTQGSRAPNRAQGVRIHAAIHFGCRAFRLNRPEHNFLFGLFGLFRALDRTVPKGQDFFFCR